MRSAIIAVLALAAASCASSQAPDRSTPSSRPYAAGGGPGGMAEMCPMAVPGTTVSAQDTPSGEAVTFATSSSQVDELRRRVRAMADMHNSHHAGGEAQGMGHGAMDHGMMRGGGMHGGGTTMPPASRARVDDVEGGARLDVTPRDPAAVEQLRSAVRTHVEHMQKDGCGAMMGTAR